MGTNFFSSFHSLSLPQLGRKYAGRKGGGLSEIISDFIRKFAISMDTSFDTSFFRLPPLQFRAAKEGRVEGKGRFFLAQGREFRDACTRVINMHSRCTLCHRWRRCATRIWMLERRRLELLDDQFRGKNSGGLILLDNEIKARRLVKGWKLVKKVN